MSEEQEEAERLQIMYEVFPALRRTHMRLSSLRDERYNCFAWAAGEEEKDRGLWWEPGKPLAGRFYWPPGVPREWSVDAFVQAYATVGYSPCENGELEEGIEKVAIFVGADRSPKHAARQLKDGYWTSKLGDWIDIEHERDALCHDSNYYGRIELFLRRPRRAP